MMEQQLEIFCRDSTTTIAAKEQTNQPNNNHNAIQAILNKIKELIKSDKHNVDSWEIPIEKISVNDFQGFGSQGDVFYGKVNQKPAAIKRLKDKLLTERSYLGNLDHKNVIKFRGVNSKFNYIIMEWCPYGNLQNLIHSGRQITSEILADFGYQIANGMAYIHSKNIIHCDLKTSNILLTHSNVLKISDFESHQLSREPSRNAFYGTLPYMAPEMIRGETYSFPVDVWSYGVVLWEILTGHEPYKNSHQEVVMWAIANQTPDSKLHIPSSFPSGYRDILEGCWQSQPKSRLTFPQICSQSQPAMLEVLKISKDRWIPLQSQWNRSIREKKNKINSDGDDLIALKQRRARDEMQISRDNKRNNIMYLKLNETCLLLEREKKELAKEKQELEIRRQDLLRREQDLVRKEQNLMKIEKDLERREQQLTSKMNDDDTSLSKGSKPPQPASLAPKISTAIE